MHTKHRTILLATLLGGAAVTGILAATSLPVVPGTLLAPLAHGEHPAVRILIQRLVRELELTPAQLQSARSVLRAHEAEISGSFDTVAQARAELRRTIRSAPGDEVAIEAAVARVNQAEASFLLCSAHLRSDLVVLLEPRQRLRIEQIESRLEERFGDARLALTTWIHED